MNDALDEGRRSLTRPPSQFTGKCRVVFCLLLAVTDGRGSCSVCVLLPDGRLCGGAWNTANMEIQLLFAKHIAVVVGESD